MLEARQKRTRPDSKTTHPSLPEGKITHSDERNGDVRMVVLSSTKGKYLQRFGKQHADNSRTLHPVEAAHLVDVGAVSIAQCECGYDVLAACGALHFAAAASAFTRVVSQDVAMKLVDATPSLLTFFIKATHSELRVFVQTDLHSPLPSELWSAGVPIQLVCCANQRTVAAASMMSSVPAIGDTVISMRLAAW